MSVLMRNELAGPGVQILQGTHQVYNVLVTEQACIMSYSTTVS
jgi:hypothetical protein